MQCWNDEKGRDSIPKDSLIILYKSLVEPYFGYCNTVWGRCGKSYIDKLQTLQNRIVTRVSYEDADHAILLRELEWLSISQIEYDSLSLIYKIKNCHAPGHTRQMFEVVKTIITITPDQLVQAIFISRK